MDQEIYYGESAKIVVKHEFYKFKIYFNKRIIAEGSKL